MQSDTNGGETPVVTNFEQLMQLIIKAVGNAYNYLHRGISDVTIGQIDGSSFTVHLVKEEGSYLQASFVYRGTLMAGADGTTSLGIVGRDWIESPVRNIFGARLTRLFQPTATIAPAVIQPTAPSAPANLQQAIS